LLLGNLVVLREFAPSIAASLMVALLVLAVPGGALAGLGCGAYRLAVDRLREGRGREAGSAIKVALVLALCLGLLAVVIGLQLAYGVLGKLCPAPASGSLFLYRALVALPAVGCSAVLAGGLLAVDRPRSVWPGLAVTAVAAVVAASIWLYRGARLPGYELAGAGLAVPVASLLGTITMGALLYAVRAGRERLFVHLAKPFDVSDVASLLRLGWRPGVLLSAAAASSLLWVTLAFRDGSSLPSTPAAVTFVLAGLALSSCQVAALRSKRAGRGLTAVVLAALLVPGIGLLVAPGLVLAPFTAHAVAQVGPRLAGVFMLHEVALWLATSKGWLAPRRSPVVELGALAVVACGAGALAVWLGGGFTALMMVLLLCRGVTVPLLRR